MHNVYLVLFLCASVYSESVRETETWMPSKAQADGSNGEFVSSGDHPDDFGFPDDEDDDSDYDGENYEDFSGSGDETVVIKTNQATVSSTMFDLTDNKIPEQEPPVKTKDLVDEIELVQKSNEVMRAAPEPEEHPSNVLMAHAGDESVFNKTEVLAALIAGGAVGLLFAVVLILLLIYRMKKKDEGSYDLGKKPIYTKAPTTEIYA